MLIKISDYNFVSASNVIYINVIPGTPFIAGIDSHDKSKFYICFKYSNSTPITTHSKPDFEKLVKLLSYASQYTEHEIAQHYPEYLI